MDLYACPYSEQEEWLCSKRFIKIYELFFQRYNQYTANNATDP